MRHQRDTTLSEFENALLLHKAGRLEEAEAIYKRMPHNTDALHLRGLIAQQRNNHEQAIDLIKQSISQKPAHAPYYFSIEIAYRALNRLDEVAAAYLKLLAHLPGDARVHEKLASALRDLGNMNDAIACYQNALAIEPDFAEAHANLGVALKLQGRLDEAAASYQKALELKPDYAEVHSNLGNVFKEQGKLDEAVTAYRRALELKPGLIETTLNLGNALRQMGRLEQAQACYESALSSRPDLAQAHNGLGAVFGERGDPDRAAASYRQALAIKPDYAEACNNLGNILKERHDLAEAVACFERAVSIAPDFAEAHYNLGSALQSQGKHEEAMRSFQQALALRPGLAPAHNNVGLIYLEQGRVEEAAGCFARSLELAPNAEAYCNLGNIFRGQGLLDDAANFYLDALAVKPAYAEAYNGLGLVFADQGKLDDAATCYQSALALDPEFADAHTNLGGCLSMQGKSDEAIVCYEKAIAADPEHAGAYSNLGLALHGKGKLKEAIDCYRRALELDPSFATARSNLLFAMQYSEAYRPEQMMSAHAEFAAQFETPLKAHWLPHANARDSDKRLKIGYVSPDFNRHAVAYFIEPVLACHDKSRFEVFCYYSHIRQDEVTQRLQALADHWIPCKHLSDDQLAAQIRADGIDILIDLAGHTGGNRLLTFARKPAPVQVTYLGYPATTGLTAIDYRITDIHAEPPGMTEQFNAEQLWRLPEIFCCYRADNSPDVIDHPPFEDSGYITFGCFNNFAKVTDPVIALWAKLLEKVPAARLMLEIHGIDDEMRRVEVEQRLARLGIPLDRSILVPRKRENQYVLYNRIDIALDPFPCNGGTTSLDTLWMGVPFVTLAGNHFTSRMGVTILTNAGLGELIAHNENEYVEIATALAQDRARLKQLRHGLRERVQASPLMDAPRFTRHLEQAYRDMWKNWCDKN